MLPEATIALFVAAICVLGAVSALVIRYGLSGPVKAVPGGWDTIRVALKTGSVPQDIDLTLWRAALKRHRSVNRYAIGFATVAVAALFVLTAMTVEVESLAFQGLLWGTVLCIVVLEAGKLDRLEHALEVEEAFAELHPDAEA